MSRPARRHLAPALALTLLTLAAAAAVTVDLGSSTTTALAGLLASLAVILHDATR